LKHVNIREMGSIVVRVVVQKNITGMDPPLVPLEDAADDVTVSEGMEDGSFPLEDEFTVGLEQGTLKSKASRASGEKEVRTTASDISSMREYNKLLIDTL
jgi:hypothetical protein